MTDYFNDDWTATREDAHGNTWHFQYGGGSSIRIRPQGSRSGDWTHQILIQDDGKTPATVTDEWLTNRADQWITDRTNDPAETRTVA
jgi:hypothetical protein